MAVAESQGSGRNGSDPSGIEDHNSSRSNISTKKGPAGPGNGTGDLPAGVDGDPIPGVDVSLEQIPGGRTAGDSDGHGPRHIEDHNSSR